MLYHQSKLGQEQLFLPSLRLVVYYILSQCSKNGLVFNTDKFRFARREVEFAGFMITKDGIKYSVSENWTTSREACWTLAWSWIRS